MAKNNDYKNRKFESQQTRKFIGATGGIGSLVETTEGAVIINRFEKWAFFRNEAHKEVGNQIDEPRLLARLKNWFKELKTLVRIPAVELTPYKQPQTIDDSKHLLSAHYFPEWFFCPSCRRFDHYSGWKRSWGNTAPENLRLQFHPPRCFACFAGSTDKQDKKKKGRFQELEQVRFILISPNGGIADIPWDRWVYASYDEKSDANDDSEDESKSRKRIDYTKDVPQNVFYRYETSDKFTDMSGIYIIAIDKDTGKEVKRKSLKGLFQLRMWESQVLLKRGESAEMKVVIRTSNSVYYPNILNSLYLPTIKNEITAPIINLIRKKLELKRSLESIVEHLSDDVVNPITITVEQLERVILLDFQEETDPSVVESNYRQNEYDFIVKKTERYEDDKRRLIFEPVPSENVGIEGIKLYRIDRLKMTAVQTSFTRQEPIDRDFYLAEDAENKEKKVVIRKQYISDFGTKAHYLPAVESYGEGIFFEFDHKTIESWLETYPSVSERAKYIQSNYDDTRGVFHSSRRIDAKFLLVHTFSHLIIKELEFLCGYPMTSLQERLYISPTMQGVLIYTIAGSEGSYGGLISLCRSKRIGQVIKSALERAKDCASDPICWHTDQSGQGFGGTNLAGCYSCSLLPETSCEEFNRFIDRRILVDEKFGYYR